MPDMLLDMPFDLAAPCERCVALDELEVIDAVTPARDFLASVARYGVITPIVATACASRPALRVIDGRRRVAAARQVGLASIPAVVYAVDGAVPDVMGVVLNQQRHDNPVADFNAIVRLQQRGAGEREISQATGMPIGRIRRRMKLARLHPDVFDGLRRGAVPVAVAEAIAGLPAPYQAGLTERLRQSGRLRMSDVSDVKTARRHLGVGLMMLDCSGGDMAVAVPAGLPEVVAALSTALLHELRRELPLEPRFDHFRQILARELAAAWRAPLGVSVIAPLPETCATVLRP